MEGNLNLLYRFIRRDLQSKYQGSMLGILWMFLVPLLMLLVYTFVFSTVFNARWGIAGESRVTFALILFASLIPYAFFSEVVGSSSGLILGNVNLVKKVKFPLELLPIVRLMTVLVQSLFSLAILSVALLLTNNLHATFLFLPIIFLPLLFLSLGISFFVSSLNVFLRDTQQIIGVALTLLMFISPIFYPLASVPESLRKYILLNPFSLIVEQFRGVLVIGELPSLSSVLVIWTISIVVLILGLLWFKKTKSAFADVV